ncbi:MAG: tetratricopeptide repeat protein [Candidatus Theseobacter exili]|nr:tetratricopeptide repeat protein [Candidatus Theseobacter exili]
MKKHNNLVPKHSVKQTAAILIIIIAATALFLSEQLLNADKVITTNGETVEGKIIYYDHEKIEVEIEYGTMTIKQDEIKQLLFDNPPLWYKADLAQSQKKFKTASELYKQLLTETSTDSQKIAKWKYNFAECLFRLGEEQKALSLFKNIKETYPETKQAIQSEKILIEKYLWQDNIEKAIRALNNIIDKHSSTELSEDQKIELEQIKIEKQHLEKYESSLLKFEEISKMERNHKNLRLYDTVIHNCRNIIRSHPKLITALYAQQLIISCYEKMTEYKKSEQEAAKHIELYKKQMQLPFYETLAQTAQKFYDQENYALAEFFYQTLSAENKEAEKTDLFRYRLAVCAEKTGKIKNAITQYERLITTTKNASFFNKGLLNMSHLMLEEKKHQELEKLLKQQLDSRPESSLAPQILYLLARSAAEQKNTEEAKGYLMQINQKYPNAPNRYIAEMLLEHIKTLNN